MKCRYKYCKNNNEVDKSIAIKIKGAYYCPECNDEREGKLEVEQLLKSSFNFMSSVVRSVLAKLVHEQGFEIAYILFVTKYIISNNKPIRNPYGLLYYCTSSDMLDLYKKEKILNDFKAIKNDLLEGVGGDKVVFKYTPKSKRITDLI